MTRGFTLLEVMVAVAILGMSLVAIFSSEVGAINVAHRARKTNVATLLARCKMGEIEELIHIEGLPAIDKKGTDECCEGAEIEGFECDWSINRIVLPELDEYGDDDSLADERQTIRDEVGTTEDYLGGGVGELAGIAMSLAYPVLKPSFEEQVRRATVTISWAEGERRPSFDVVQFLVSDQPAAEDEPDDEEGGS